MVLRNLQPLFVQRDTFENVQFSLRTLYKQYGGAVQYLAARAADPPRLVLSADDFHVCLVIVRKRRRSEDDDERREETGTGDDGDGEAGQEGGEEDVREDERRGEGEAPEGGRHRRTCHG